MNFIGNSSAPWDNSTSFMIFGDASSVASSSILYFFNISNGNLTYTKLFEPSLNWTLVAHFPIGVIYYNWTAAVNSTVAGVPKFGID